MMPYSVRDTVFKNAAADGKVCSRCQSKTVARSRCPCGFQSLIPPVRRTAMPVHSTPPAAI